MSLYDQYFGNGESLPLEYEYSNSKTHVNKKIIPKKHTQDEVCKVKIEVLRIITPNRGGRKRPTRRIDTGIPVLRKHWSIKKQEVKTGDPNHKEKNVKINALFHKINTYVNNLQDSHFRQGVEDEFTQLKDFFPSPRERKAKNIIDFMDEYIAYRKSINPKQGSWKEFVTVRNRMEKFCTSQNRFYSFDELNYSFSDQLSRYLSDAGYSQNTIAKHYTTFRTFLYHYYDRRNELNLLIDESFKSRNWINIKKTQSPPNPFDEKDWQTIINAKYSATYHEKSKKIAIKLWGDRKDNVSHHMTEQRFEKTKDRIIWACSTGLRFGDQFQIDKSYIKNDEIVISVSKTERTKTENTVYVPLNKYSRAIFKKYSQDMTKLKIANASYNKQLKLFLSCIGVVGGEKYTVHNCRDFFITYAVLQEVPAPFIIDWVGHADFRMLKRYLKINSKKRKEMMAQVFGS